MATNLSKEEFATFISNAKDQTSNAYETLRNLDTSTATKLNSYSGNYQNAIANAWSENYTIAVNGLTRMYNAIVAAEGAGSNLANDDASISANFQG